MRILIIGCGSIGERHLGNLKRLGAGEMLLCDTDRKRLSLVAEKYKIKLFFNDLREAMKEKIDAAVVCTPPVSHVSIGLKLIERGAHLFIEKPLSDRLNGIETLVRKARSRRLVVLVGYNLRFNPGLRLIKKMICDGKIGRVFSARAEFGQYLPDWRPRQDYRKSYTARRSCGGGIILDASHEIDYLRWLLGEVKEVGCFAGRVSGLDVDTEDTAEIVLLFKRGAIAGIHLDFIRHDYTRNCELIGEKGTIVWDYPDNSVKLYSADKKVWRDLRIKSKKGRMYADEMRHFIDCILGKSKPLADAKDAARTLEVALAAKSSAKRGAKIKL